MKNRSFYIYIRLYIELLETAIIFNMKEGNKGISFNIKLIDPFLLTFKVANIPSSL